jgi:hypothetical protein
VEERWSIGRDGVGRGVRASAALTDWDDALGNARVRMLEDQAEGVLGFRRYIGRDQMEN